MTKIGLYATIENIITIIVCGSVVLGLAYIFRSYHCLWGLLILLNSNSIKSED